MLKKLCFALLLICPYTLYACVAINRGPFHCNATATVIEEPKNIIINQQTYYLLKLKINLSPSNTLEPQNAIVPSKIAIPRGTQVKISMTIYTKAHSQNNGIFEKKEQIEYSDIEPIQKK